jgi:5-methylthioadenosine/S-adenosylhomocysteine deaminase
VHTETLIHAKWIIPVEPHEVVLENHSLAIADNKIKAILPTVQAREEIDAEHIVELLNHALIPGLVNTHTHAAMSLFRGLADDLPLMTWLNDHIWPAEHKWVHEEFVADGTRLAIAEMLKSGTTCFNDMYFFPNITARVAQQIGMRSSVGLIVTDFPTAWADNAEHYIHKAVELHDALRNEPLISTCFAPHAPYTVSDQPLKQLVTLANELDVPIHMHIHETQDEINGSIEQYKKRPLERLKDLGLLSPSLIGVHMTQWTDDEMSHFARSNAHVVHCPESNLKLASGFCPVKQLQDHGINVALGTDGAASNNDLDMLGEMRTAALLAKGVAQDASALPAAQALRMATLNGAIALGLQEHIGTLEVGKEADVVAIDLGHINTLPVFNPLSHIVYAAGREQVSDVWIAGKRQIANSKHTIVDVQRIQTNCQQWQAKLSRNQASSD